VKTTRAAFVALGCTVVAALAMPHSVWADSSLGGPFIRPLYGARAWGMAGAVIARIDDESAVDWNPAGISQAARGAGVSAVELVPDAFLTQAQAAFAMPLGHSRNTETSVSRHAVGALYTNLSADIGAGETYSENHLRLAYAYSPQPVVTFAVAGNVALASSGVDHFDAWGTSVDMAVKLRVTRAWTLALVGRDAFSRYTFEDGRDNHKERQYVAGIAHSVPGGLDLEADFVYVHDGWLRTMVGAETPYFFDRLALRSGVAILSAGEGRAQYGFGASVRATQHLLLHYAANLDDENAFGTTHRLSLSVRW
jgi:hypothetical protein